MNGLKRLAWRLSRAGEWIGTVGILVMVVVTCADVLGAKIFNRPVPGSTEIVSLVQVAVIIFAVAATQRERGHISVEMFVLKMPPRLRATVKSLTSLAGLVLFSLLVWEGFALGNEYLEAGEVTATILIPFYPFAWGFALALVPVVMMMLCDLVEALTGVFR